VFRLGHVLRKKGSYIEKKIIQGTTRGQKRRGRPKVHWHDISMKWTGLSGDSLLRSVEDRIQWRKSVHEAATRRNEED